MSFKLALHLLLEAKVVLGHTNLPNFLFMACLFDNHITNLINGLRVPMFMTSMGKSILILWLAFGALR